MKDLAGLGSAIVATAPTELRSTPTIPVAIPSGESMLHFEFGQQPVGLGASATYLLPYTTLVESQYLLR